MAEQRKLDERVAGLESGHEALREALDSRLGKIERTLDRVTDQLAAVRTPNIATWIAAAGVAVGISGLFLTVGMTIGGMALSSISREMETMRSYFRERTASNEQAVRSLDTSLQREMRLLDDAIRAEITGLDTRLQHEQDLKIMANESERRADLLSLETRLLRREIELRADGTLGRREP